ncbi:keratin-associated protein 20-2-like [Bubalus bubalis]|nr:keratin-associated protein 20-2-like [Bubalus bubalis]
MSSRSNHSGSLGSGYGGLGCGYGCGHGGCVYTCYRPYCYGRYWSSGFF